MKQSELQVNLELYFIFSVAITADIDLTCPPGHTSHNKGRGPRDRSGSLDAADTQPLASSAARTRTTQSSSVMQTIHTKLLKAPDF